MFVRKHMTTAVITALPTASVEDALYIMREKGIGQLPVLNYDGELLGMVTERDLLRVSPSPAAAMSLHEMLYALSQLRLSEIMDEELITVHPDAPLEEAALLMIDNRREALPVVEEGRLVGIISQTDIFRLFLQMLEMKPPAIQITLLVPDEKGVLFRLTRLITDSGGNILSMGQFKGRREGTRTLTINVAELPLDRVQRIAEAVEAEMGYQTLYLRQATPTATEDEAR